MKNLKKDLQSVVKEINALEKKMQKLIAVIGRNQNTGIKNKSKAKRAKVTTAKRTAAEKKDVALTATDQVLKVIKLSRKGADVPTIKAKTGFEDKKVRNIVFRASKDGKIKKAGRGVYVTA